MDIRKILIIFLLIVIYSILFWPTLYIYTHTVSNTLVKINRITGEAYYFAGDKWRKIENEKVYASGFKPLETKTYTGGVRMLGDNEYAINTSKDFVSFEEYSKNKKPK